MTIGLITEPTSYSGKHLLNRILGICICKEILNTVNPFDISAQVLPYSYERLKKMSLNRFEKLINKCLKRMKKRGITKLILSDCIYELCQSKGFDTNNFINGTGKELFCSLMPLCTRQVAKKVGLDLFSANVCISDFKMDRISEYLVRELCFDTKSLYLCTRNLRSAELFCETFCDESGLWIDVRENIDFYCDILLDVDNCQVKIGNDLFIRDADLGFDFSGYKVSHIDIAAQLPRLDYNCISWIYNYY